EARPPLYFPRLCRGMPTEGSASIIFSSSLPRSLIMFNNGWVDEFLGMFDIYFYMILLIT
ncbi:MAG: hypothetical protein ACK4WG_04285, partial [Aphanizomenon sp.]